ncbi:similar to Saccharomyces cerevisiae YDR249C Putative protein of unknown function [Maudiozyma barnettii]|uniref:Uncharacterized protein n=1 Tax=Maudiozyma barnettii TaxID=61262 RepID=A0A8H2VG70_9SACH|nr:hypothetical protein [Kazachstania barnettii]CAB4255049.1 similar to Saccharomyces cerevisiae YDR249C Putative protein of unknown function [Kazachstania barnettii]CAD1783320.1 similar to Saccharomyces cerevisiae YDR249C Putative protein of unknown function [Kazachstania barnettii]
MGFATVGYPTRHHKRRRLPDHQDCPIYYHNHHKNVRTKRTRKIPNEYSLKNIDDTSTIPQIKRQSKKRITIQDLPCEIVQKIFILANDTTTMPQLSKFFYNCLRPTDYLIQKIFIERYFFSPKKYGIERCLQDDGYLVNPEIFNNTLFAGYFLTHMSSLKVPIDLFAPRSLVPYLHDENLPDDFIFDIGRLGKGEFDLPIYFYHNFDVYCNNPSILQTLSKYFTISNVPLILENFLDWSLSDGVHYNVSTIIEVLICIGSFLNSRNISINSQHLMVITLHRLYNYDMSDPVHHWQKLFNSSDQEEINKYKQEFVHQIIQLFYGTTNKNGTKLLSGNEIWQILVGLSNMKLIGVFTKYGVYPEISVIGTS